MRAGLCGVSLLGLLLIVSCSANRRASQGGSGKSVTGQTHLVAHPRETVYSAIQAYMADRKWPLAETNAERGFIRSATFHLASDRDYAHCQTGRRSAVTGYEAQINIAVSRVTANGTNVAIETRISAMSGSGQNSDCLSTGTLESDLVAGIDSVVAAWKK